MWRSRRGGRDVDPDQEEDEDDNEFKGEYDVSFEFRFETAKLLLELDENTDEAIDVLEVGPATHYSPHIRRVSNPRFST
jgi:hypothetical protein